MVDATTLPLLVTVGQRFDLELDWELATGGAAIPMDGFASVMNIYSSDGTPLFTSSGDTPDIPLEQDTDNGKINFSIISDLVARLLVPYRVKVGWYYRIDLVDVGDPANIIPFVHGPIVVQSQRDFALFSGPCAGIAQGQSSASAFASDTVARSSQIGLEFVIGEDAWPGFAAVSSDADIGFLLSIGEES